MTPFDVIRGDGPIILGQPHGGTWLPEGMADRLTPIGQALADTDWHIGPLHDGLLPGATIVRSNVHRYVIDANRDPSGSSLYPGQNTTGLCPETDFDGAPLWQPGQAPDADEVAERRALYHTPYHAALAEQIDRVRDRYGVAVLYDCHSIRSNIPFLFKGLLPVFNVGTNDGHSCSVAVTDAVMAPLLASMRSTVLNGRFKGGWTTRHYGRPGAGVHAIQMELSQRAYLTDESAPWDLDPVKAGRLRTVLTDALLRLDRLARFGAISNASAPLSENPDA